jgi:hypothetical protein
MTSSNMTLKNTDADLESLNTLAVMMYVLASTMFDVCTHTKYCGEKWLIYGRQER